MRKILFIVLLVILQGCKSKDVAKELIGTWYEEAQSESGIVFTENGEMLIVKMDNPTESISKMKIKYTVEKEDKETFIRYTFYQNGNLLGSDRDKFKIEDNKLLLPKTVEGNGQMNRLDYQDVYIRHEVIESE